jgi:hypothetical protein
LYSQDVKREAWRLKAKHKVSMPLKDSGTGRSSLSVTSQVKVVNTVIYFVTGISTPIDVGQNINKEHKLTHDHKKINDQRFYIPTTYPAESLGFVPTTNKHRSSATINARSLMPECEWNNVQSLPVNRKYWFPNCVQRGI